MDFRHGAAGRVKKTIPEIPSGSAHAAPPCYHVGRSEGAWRNLTLKWYAPQWGRRSLDSESWQDKKHQLPITTCSPARDDRGAKQSSVISELYSKS